MKCLFEPSEIIATLQENQIIIMQFSFPTTIGVTVSVALFNIMLAMILFINIDILVCSIMFLNV